MDPKGQPWRIIGMGSHKRSHFNPSGAKAKSSLRAPMVRIEDHKSEVLSCDFHPSGEFIVSANRKGQIHFCDVDGTFSRMTKIKGHKGAVMEVCFSRDGNDFYSCSSDKTLGIWDTSSGYRKGYLEGHFARINSVRGARIGYPVLCSGSNDGTVRIWDARNKGCAMTLWNGTEVAATCFSQNGECAISGGFDKDIKIWDLRTRQIVCRLIGHKGRITGISLSPCGSYLLSNSVDNTIRVWDIRPHVTFKRCVGCFPTYHFSMDGLLRCAWSPDGTMVTAGTTDRDVYIRDAMTGNILREVPGHEGGINEIAFHPKEPVILSASDDKYLFLHEI